MKVVNIDTVDDDGGDDDDDDDDDDDYDDDDDDEISWFLLGLATSRADLSGFWVLDFHH